MTACACHNGGVCTGAGACTSRASDVSCWPGTDIVKSTGNAFDWRGYRTGPSLARNLITMSSTGTTYEAKPVVSMRSDSPNINRITLPGSSPNLAPPAMVDTHGVPMHVARRRAGAKAARPDLAPRTKGAICLTTSEAERDKSARIAPPSRLTVEAGRGKKPRR